MSPNAMALKTYFFHKSRLIKVTDIKDDGILEILSTSKSGLLKVFYSDTIARASALFGVNT
jgi:hypothetical protein